MKIKAVKVNEDNWMKLWNLKLEMRAINLDTVVGYLLNQYERNKKNDSVRY